VSAAAASRIGVVVATRDRRTRTLATVQRLLALPERPPIVVVDDASRDGTADAVRVRFPEVRVMRFAHSQGPGARNAGARALESPYVAFSDDDSWWEPGALARAAALFDAHPRLGLIAARVLVGAEQRLDPTCAAMAAGAAGRDRGPGVPVLGFLACGAILRRAALLAVGGFPVRYGIGGEERLLALDLSAAGWELRYLSEIVAYHWPDATGERPGRRERMVRNDLWSEWLRRPAHRLPGATARRLAEAGPRRETLHGALAALRGLRWVARERRPLPPHVEHAVRALERSR
jgi:GT2 family glycosyltransferase